MALCLTSLMLCLTLLSLLLFSTDERMLMNWWFVNCCRQSQTAVYLILNAVKYTIILVLFCNHPNVEHESINLHYRVSSPKNENYVINESPSCHSKLLRPLFIFEAQFNFRYSPRAFCPSIENVCTLYCPWPERK